MKLIGQKMQPITREDLQRHREIERLLRLEQEAQHQAEIDRQNRDCNRCWKTSLVVVSALVIICMFLEVVGAAGRNDHTFGAISGGLAFVLLFMVFADVCVKLGVRF